MRQVPKTLQHPLFPIFFITFLDQIAITICFPVLTFICFDSHSSLFYPNTSHAIRSYWFGLLSALPHFIPLFAAPLLGILSDMFGRKKLLLVGALGIVIFGIFASISIIYSLMPLLLAGYLISGFCVRTEPIALAVVADCSDNTNKLTRMGYLQFYIAIGATIGPILGGFLIHRYFFNTLNFAVPYIICSFVGIITVLSTRFFFKETHLHPHSVEKLKSSWREIFKKSVFPIIILLILTQIAWRLYYQFVPPILKISANYSGTEIGLFMGLVAVWLTIASSIGIKYLNRFFNQKQILRICLFAMAFGLLIVISAFYVTNIHLKTWLIWLSALPIAMGDVIIFCIISTVFSTLVSSEHHGKIMGLNFIIVSAVWAFTGLVGGYFFAINIKLPIFIAFFALLLLFPTLSSQNKNLAFILTQGLQKKHEKD